MSELRDLYQEVILDHYKRPRNQRRPAGANRDAQGHNPLCGDRVTISIELDGDRIKDVGFSGSGCAISTASTSMMTEAIKGKTVKEVEALFARFHHLVTSSDDPGPDVEALDKLAVFQGVREFPVRVKCATLAWHTLRAALEAKPDLISTE
jgi:nitrogen fixation NifU-like protein